MRAVVRCVLVVIAIAATVVAEPADVSLAAANQSYAPAIASVLPTRGEVVGVAHPVVVTFSAPVANKRAAERTLDIRSVPAMTASSNGSTTTSCSGFPTDTGRRTARWRFLWTARRRISRRAQPSSALPISRITRSP